MSSATMQDIVDRIRESLNPKRNVSAEEMVPLAAEYGQAVAHVNERLLVCTRLLRKGLRAEAIQQATSRPDLLNVCASLDFTELDDWLEILKFYDVPLPNILIADAIQEVQVAMLDLQPLEDLLRQHRRLAIAKAPLAWRLKILRAIRSSDSGNGIWTQDVEEWEKARLRQLPSELDQAIKSRNFNACQKLTAELNHAHWLVSPPQPLAQRAQNAADRFEYQAQSRELKSIGQALHDAVGEQDWNLARTLREQWNSVSAAMKQEPPKELLDLAETSLLQLKQIDDQEAKAQRIVDANANLEATLTSSRSEAEINNAYQVVLAANPEEELDPLLERRYGSKLRELQTATRRRAVIVLTSIVSLAVVACFVVIVSLRQANYARQLSEATSGLESLLEQGRVDEASSYWDSLAENGSPILIDPRMLDLQSQLEESLAQEEQREAQFEQLLAELKKLPIEEVSLSRIEQLESIARSENELIEVRNLRRNRTELDVRITKEQTADLEGRLAVHLQEFEQLSNTASSEVGAELELVHQKLAGLKTKYPRARSNSLARVDDALQTISRRRSNLLDEARKQKQIVSSLERIRNVSTLQMLEQRMRQHVGQFPDSLTATEFSEVSGEGPYWSRVQDWNAALSNLRSLAAGRTVAKAEQCARELKGLSGKIDLETLGFNYPAVDQSLQRIIARDGLLTQLATEVTDGVMKDIVTLGGQLDRNSQTVGRRFVTSDEWKRQMHILSKLSDRSSTSLDVIVNSDLTVGKVVYFGRVSMSNQPREYCDLLAANIQSQRENLITNWEGQFNNVLEDLRDRKDIDRVFKEELLRQIVTTAVGGSAILETHCRNTLMQLELATSRFAEDWYEGGEFDSQLDPKLHQSLSQSLEHSEAALRQRDKAFLRMASAELVWLGIVEKDSQNKARAFIKSPPEINGVLVVVAPHTAQPGMVRFVEVGRFRDGKATLADDPNELLAGRPLFLKAD